MNGNSRRATFCGHTEVMIMKRDEAVWARRLQLWSGAFPVAPSIGDQSWPRLSIIAVANFSMSAPQRCWPLRCLASQSRRPQQSKPKIGVIGGGNIGGTIGGLWVKAGYQVFFSSRHPEELKPLTDRLGPLAKGGTVGEALDFGEVILIAVPYKAIPDLAKEYGPKFAGKIVVDPANAVARRDGEELLKETKEKGIGNTTESYLKGSHVVRAFNSMSYTNFLKEAHRAGDPMAIPIAGDDARAVQVASQLVRDAGFEPVAVPLARAQEFAQGGPIYGQQLTGQGIARALRAREMTESNSGSTSGSDSSAPEAHLSKLLASPDRCDAGRASGARLVLALHFFGAGLVLHSASDPGPDGRRRRGEQSAVAVHRHAGRHAGSERAVLGARQAAAAPAVHFAVLSFLCGDNTGVRRGAALGISRADHLGRPIFLYLDFCVQFVRGFDFLVDGRRHF